MRKIVILILVFFTTLNLANSRYKLIKIWQYGYSEKRGWVYHHTDAWGGENFWCVGPGDACGIWDWKAEYWVEIIGQNPTPPHTNTPEFGHQLVKNAAKEANFELPPNLELPIFDIKWEENNN